MLAFGEHGVGLADARGRAQLDAEMTGRLDLPGGICVRLRGLPHAFAGPVGAGAPGPSDDLGGLDTPGIDDRTRQPGQQRLTTSSGRWMEQSSRESSALAKAILFSSEIRQARR